MHWQRCTSSTISHPLYSILPIFGALSYSGSVSIVFNIVLELFTGITHNHLEGDLGKSLFFFHHTSPWLLREETPEKYKLKIQRGSMPEENIIGENNIFYSCLLFWMTSLVISFIHESWGLVSLWSNLLAPLNNFARIYGIIWHYNSFYSTMTHLLHNDSSEYSIRIECISCDINRNFQYISCNFQYLWVWSECGVRE